MNFLMTFVVGQSFLSMMCAMKFGIFLFFAAMVCVMSLFVTIVLPETKGIPLVRAFSDSPVCLQGRWLQPYYRISFCSTGSCA